MLTSVLLALLCRSPLGDAGAAVGGRGVAPTDLALGFGAFETYTTGR